ncbi:MAG: 4Fe-4S binding protein [Candidatus Methanomethyliales bacterium]|nr:4Fe-4S binding protein [Candidatus Methanomethylicales archaeon]
MKEYEKEAVGLLRKRRKIIEIDEEKCDGCGLCVPACPEGALQLIDGKLRLVSEIFCDGLGACIGSCPKGAIRVVEREAEPYNEREVMKRIIKQGPNVIKAHLKHLKEHGQFNYLAEALQILHEQGIGLDLEFAREIMNETRKPNDHGLEGLQVGPPPLNKRWTELRQWPIQLTLVPVSAPYFLNSDLLVAADCVPFAYADFHQDLLKGKSLVIGCPKLDDAQFYKEKLAHLIKTSNIKSITVVTMEVPCCHGLKYIVEEALGLSNRNVPVNHIIIKINGEKVEGSHKSMQSVKVSPKST